MGALGFGSHPSQMCGLRCFWTRLQCLWSCHVRVPLGVFLGGLSAMSAGCNAGFRGLSRPMSAPPKAIVGPAPFFVTHPGVRLPSPQSVSHIETHLQPESAVTAALGGLPLCKPCSFPLEHLPLHSTGTCPQQFNQAEALLQPSHLS